jgi:hypothetical protein
MGKAPDLKPTEPTEPGFVGFEGEAPANFPITRNWEAPVDAYGERLGNAMQSLASPEYPAGMIVWLGDACPILYTELTERLPDKIQRLWEAQAPLDEFERVLDLWKEAHRTGCRIYRQHLVAEKRGEREGGHQIS